MYFSQRENLWGGRGSDKGFFSGGNSYRGGILWWKGIILGENPPGEVFVGRQIFAGGGNFFRNLGKVSEGEFSR